MVYISIGNACNVKYQIDKFIGKKETLFFDRLITDINSVNTILECDNLEKILYPDNIIKIGVKDNKSRISIKSLSNCISIHDIGINISEKDIMVFIDRYKRRYDRIINYIKSDEIIYFIRYETIDETNKKRFIQNIKRINPYCQFSLINIKICQESNTIIMGENYIEINLTDTLVNNREWTTSDLNWEKIFTDIKTNI
jgi:hypothetical protein